MLEWRDNNLPVSKRFDDPYYSKQDGRAETEYVFIKSNNLPQRWPTMDKCVIAELGFGTGLNFIETVRHWQLHKREAASLNFISFEQYPIERSDMAKALSAWPELSELAAPLIAQWVTGQAKLDLALTDNTSLTVYFGDANIVLPKTDFVADAWYLDGFSPAKNPQLWNPGLMNQVAQHTVQSGTFATYTAAGFVRRNLIEAGFSIRKVDGFGHKRDMLIGTKA